MKIVIVVPIYKDELTELEAISLNQLLLVLNSYEIWFIKPYRVNFMSYSKVINERIPENIMCFDDKYFIDHYSYSKLLTSPMFYLKFKKYNYMLIYQLDAFVFRNELKEWCSKKFDYIGAPLYDGFHGANENSIYIGLQNGGLSLRNISKTLSVFKSIRIIELLDRINQFNFNGQLYFLLKYFLIPYFKFNRYESEIVTNQNDLEDVFWCWSVNKILKQKETYKYFARFFSFMITKFEIAVYSDSLLFSFDNKPQLMFEETKNELPFGCHGWFRYLDFWRLHFEKYDYII